MSTKIYNAYRTTKSVPSLLKFLNKQREYILRETEAGIHHSFDKLPIKYTKDIDSFLTFLYKEYMSYSYSKYGIDFNSCVRIYQPRSNSSFGQYVFLLVHHNRWISAIDGSVVDLKFLNKNGFQDFHYQNQTDPPDNISEKDFEKRGKIWDILMKEEFKNNDFKNHTIFEYVSLYDIRTMASNIFYDMKRDVK